MSKASCLALSQLQLERQMCCIHSCKFTEQHRVCQHLLFVTVNTLYNRYRPAGTKFMDVCNVASLNQPQVFINRKKMFCCKNDSAN